LKKKKDYRTPVAVDGQNVAFSHGEFINKQNFKTDDIVSITGILELNKDDIEHFNYILKECKGMLVK
jgi:hypothetical protein